MTITYDYNYNYDYDYDLDYDLYHGNHSFYTRHNSQITIHK